MARVGVTGEAASWLLKALHPASPEWTAAPIPDPTGVPVATPEYVQTITVGTNSAGNAWDCCVVQYPTFPAVAHVVTAAKGFDFTNVSNWGSGTVSLVSVENCIATPSFGWVKIAPTAANAAVSGTTWATASTPARWRTLYRSMTAYLVSSDIQNEGTVTSVQVEPQVGLRGGYYGTTILNGTPGGVAVRTTSLPLSESSMTLLDPKVRVAPAKTGVYVPMYNCGPTFQWCDRTPLSTVLVDLATPPGVYVPAPAGIWPGLIDMVWPYDPNNGATQNCNWMLSSGILNTVASITEGTDNQTCAVTIFRGLDSSASLTFKFVTAVEIQPLDISPVKQFVTSSAKVCPEAIALYYATVHDMPHAYPSSANFLGAVLAGLGAAARMLAPVILPALGSGLQKLVEWVVPAPTAAPPNTPASETRAARESLRSTMPDRAFQPEMARSSTNVRLLMPRPRIRASSATSSRGSRRVRVAVTPRKRKARGRK